MEGGRRRLSGAEAIGAALARGEPLRLIVLDGENAAARSLLEPAHAAGVPVQTVGSAHLERLCAPGDAGGAVALVAAGPCRDAAQLLARDGPAWLLSGIAYPGNAGMAIRTAEVSGAAGIFVDAAFDHARRREAVRASMRADRFLPVLWMASDAVVSAARDAGRRIIALEDSGKQAPWEADLTGPALFVVGGERAGVPDALLERSDAVLRIPTFGFIRSYNLQAAVAMVAGERLRQLRSAQAETGES